MTSFLFFIYFYFLFFLMELFIVPLDKNVYFFLECHMACMVHQMKC